MNQAKKNSPAGLSLLEIIIAVTISLLLLLIINATYNLNQRAYIATDSQAEITQNGRVILDRLIREVRQTPDIATELPLDTSNPDSLPAELMFQNGHNTSQIEYIRYFLDGSDIKRQIIVYFFLQAPENYVHYYDIDSEEGEPPYGPPRILVLEEKIIGEYASDFEFWGDRLVNINLYLQKNNQTEIINTAVYGRNL